MRVGAARPGRAGTSPSVEQTRLGRRLTGRPPGSFRRGTFPIAVGENLLDHHRLFDAGNDPDHPATGSAALDVDAKYALQALRLKLIEARRSAGVGASESPLEGRWLPLPRLAGVTCARYRLWGTNTPQVDPGLRLPEPASRAMKSNGSKMTCVVPSR